MNVAAWCIKNNRSTIFILILIVLLGFQSFIRLPRLENPEFTLRVAMITTAFPGASPLKVEQLVTDPLEKKIRAMPELDFVTSQSLTGVSIITVFFQDKYKEMNPIWQKLRNKVSDAAVALPDGVLAPQVNDEFGDVFGVVVALTGDGFTYREMKDVADDVRDQLLTLKNVAKVELHGIQDERIFVDFSSARLAEYNFSPVTLANILSAQNTTQPGGNGLVGPERIVIEPTGEFKSIEQIAKTSLRIPGRTDGLHIEDLAQVTRGFVDPPAKLVRLNNQPAIVLAVSMAKGGKITELGPRVMKKLEEIRADLPIGLDFNIVTYQPKFVDRSIQDFLINLLEAFLFVFIVVLIFTGLRTGFVVGLLVPMAMLACMVLMPVFDIHLQTVSIASLIIALGMLVDNGVVVSEESLVRLAEGKDRLHACAGAAKNLATPMLAASLSTIFAFLPIATAQSDIGEYCYSLFVVVTLTLLCSWVLSMTMIPLLSYYILKPKPAARTFSSLFYRMYRSLLILNLKARIPHLVAALGITAFAVWAFGFVPTIFFPPNEREMFYIDLYTPYGTDIRTTLGSVSRLEKNLLSQPEVKNVGTFLGGPGPRWYLSLTMEDHGSHYARMVVNTKTLEGVDKVMETADEFIDRNLTEVRYVITKLENGPPVGAPIQVRLTGPDMKTIYRLRERIKEIMAKTPGVVNIRDDWGEWTKKIRVKIDQEKAKQAGFTTQDIALSLLTQISGFTATQYREGKEIIPIVLRSHGTYRNDLGKIEDLDVYSWQDGRSLPLRQMARAKLRWQPSNIRRRDGQRTMTLKADVSGRFASDITADLMVSLGELQKSPEWPGGYSLAFGGEDEESSQASDSIMAGLPLAAGLILLLLVLQFNSFRRMTIIILTIPPMIVGITFGLLLTEAPFGFMAMLGMISLTGIIINNAIIMIDSIEKERKGGHNIQDAIVVSAQKRLRPIVMTAATTIAGLIPLSLQGGEMWRPMANTLIFGLAFATALTLLLCPVLYSLFFRVRFKGYQWRDEILQPAEAVD